MISESERRIKILEYVRKHSLDSDGKPIKKITKSDVMRHLKEVRSMTIHKTIVELIKEGKIKMMKDKPYSQTDYLVFNKNNEFYQINEKLSEAEALINDFEKSINLIKQRRQEHKLHSNKEYDKSNSLFQQIYFQLLNLTLVILLTKTSAIPSDKDIQILYRKNINLLVKLLRIMAPSEELLSGMLAKISELLSSTLEKMKSSTALRAYKEILSIQEIHKMQDQLTDIFQISETKTN